MNITQKNQIIADKQSIEDLRKFNLEFRYCYTNLHSLIDVYNKQIIKLNLDNVNQIKIEIERYKVNIDKMINLIDKLSN